IFSKEKQTFFNNLLDHGAHRREVHVSATVAGPCRYAIGAQADPSRELRRRSIQRLQRFQSGQSGDTTMFVTTSKRESSFPSAPATALKCVVCKRPFDFTSGEAAIVLRHVAYYYDLVHDGACLEQALDWIFVEPGYDCAAFGRDLERRSIVRAGNAWALVE